MKLYRTQFAHIVLSAVLFLAAFFISKPVSAQCLSGDCQVGYGTMQYGKNQKYIGMFDDGEKNGVGTLTGKKGEVYIGGFMSDKKFGKGVLVKKEKIEKSGYWLNDKFIKVIDPDSVDYKLSGDCQDGIGIYIFKNGDSYTGAWKDGKKDGMGMLFIKGLGTYTGEFANDQQNGFGTMQWVDRGTYKGGWKDGLMNGDGVYYNPDQTIEKKGKWMNGVFQLPPAIPKIKVGDTLIVDSFNAKVRLIISDSRKQFPILRGDKVAGGIITGDYMSKMKLFADADDEVTHTDVDANGNEKHFEYKSIKYNAGDNSRKKIDEWHSAIKAGLQGNWRDAKLPSGYGFEMINDNTGTHIIIKSNESSDVSVEFYTK